MAIKNNSFSSISILSEFGELPLLRMRFFIKFSEAKNVPSLMGSAWRGLIGWKLRKLICPFEKHAQCNGCSIAGHCPYYILYELKSSLPGLGNSPKGYILYPEILARNSIIALNVTLIGLCTKFSSVVAKAVIDGQRVGIGSDRNRYEILSWGEVLPNEVFALMPSDPVEHGFSKGTFPLSSFVKGISIVGKDINVKFVTPVRLRKKGKYMSVIDWPFYFSSFFRRLESINCILNQGPPFGKTKWKIIKQQFDKIQYMKSDFRWCDYHRYSNRQRKKVPMGGLVGNVRIQSPEEWIIECWKSISILHIGKGAAMGMGKVLIS